MSTNIFKLLLSTMPCDVVENPSIVRCVRLAVFAASYITKTFRGFYFRWSTAIHEKCEILHRAKISRYTVI